MSETVKQAKKKNMLPRDAIKETYFIFVTYRTHKTCYKLPSESPCLRGTSSAASIFSWSTNKSLSRCWQTVPPCDQQTGPDRTGPESCQSNRHHTSIYVTNRPQSNCSTNWGLYYWSELWERAGVELWNVSSVLLRLCRTLDGVWGKEKYGWKFGHFKTDRSQTVRTQNWLSLYSANGRTETCRKQLRRPPFSSLHVRFAQWHCKRIEPSVTSRHADWYTITEDLNERRLHTHGQLGSIWSSYKMMKTLRYAETSMTNSPHQCRR